MKRTLRAAIAIALAAMVNPLLAQTCWKCVSDGGNPPFYSCLEGAPGWRSCTSLGDGGVPSIFPAIPVSQISWPTEHCVKPRAYRAISGPPRGHGVARARDTRRSRSREVG